MAPLTTEDTPVFIRGFVTDPKLVGYQILTNYESTYWAPLVGNDSWRLYEILRSFCHQGNSACYPSINLLLTILGIKDRSVLIGRAKPKVVNGKEYCYLGLIQTLQSCNLVIAEVEGAGPKLRYTFHVNLTPGLLSAEQLSQLPELLQKKHAELLERCMKEQKKLEAKKQPPKMQLSASAESAPAEPEKGIGNSNTPIGNSNTPSWNFQYKQHPYNNTQLTRARSRDDNNNNSSGHDDVVVAVLTAQGISEKVARRLEQHYSPARIDEKIGYLEFLLAERPAEVKRPAAWLRKAIEDDYGAPDGFVSAAERERRRQDEAQEQARYTELAKTAQAVQQSKKEAEAAEREARVRRVRAQYGATAADSAFWEEAQREIQLTTPRDISALVADAQILKRTEDAVWIGVEREAEWRQLQHPGTVCALKRTLGQVTGKPVELEVVLLHNEHR